MRLAARGDQAAFGLLYDRHAAWVMRVLFRLCGHRQQAEDLTQEVFLSAWRAAPRWKARAPVSAWLHRIARNVGWNAAAHAARRRPLRREGAARSLRVVQDTARTPGPVNEARPEITEAILALRPKLRWAFVLVRLEGQSLTAAAALTGVPVGTIKSRLAAAEAKLRAALRAPERGPLQ